MSRRISPAIVALAIALAILASGCGSIPNPLATATPPDALHPNPPVAAVATIDPVARPDQAR